MKLSIKLISEQDFFVVTIEDDRTLQDIFSELANVTNSSFILLGDRILQKSVIEQIEAA